MTALSWVSQIVFTDRLNSQYIPAIERLFMGGSNQGPARSI
jgi:hypothetical protein